MRSVGMSRHMPIEHVDQGARFGRGRRRRQGRSRRFNANSLLRRQGAVQRLRQVIDGFSLANGLRGQPHPERPLNTKDQFGSRQTVDSQVPLDPAGCANLDEPGTLGMQLAGQSRDDRDHVAFARILVRRRRDFIRLPSHRSDYKDSIRRRFAVDQTVGYGHSASSPAKPASGVCSDPPPGLPGAPLDQGLAFNPTRLARSRAIGSPFASYRAPGFGQPTSKASVPGPGSPTFSQGSPDAPRRRSPRRMELEAGACHTGARKRRRLRALTH